MPTNRRTFLSAIGTSLGASIVHPGSAATAATPAASGGSPAVKAICFDAFPILDPRPIGKRVLEIFPERGTELIGLWRTRQFEYTWLRTISGRYADFWHVTEDALVYAAKTLNLDLTPAHRARIMDAHLEIGCYPDVPPALATLKKAGVRLAFLSNMTATMLETGIKNSKLEGMFEYVLSTDRVKTYKPDPRAYQMGLDILKLKTNEVVFAAFASWDATGAKWFGYRTFWVNRMNHVREELGVVPDAAGGTLGDLVKFVVA